MVCNDRIQIKPPKLDFYFPSLKLAIEHCGIYWHCERKRQKNYHNDKYKSCFEQGIRLIQIFEDEMENKKEIVKSLIMTATDVGYINKLNAYECDIKKLSQKEASEFFNENHLSGYGVACSCLALFSLGQPVFAIIYQKTNIVRYCNCLYTVVEDGLERLTKEIKATSITADLRFDNVVEVTKLGFNEENITITEFWTNNFKRKKKESAKYNKKIWDAGIITFSR